MCRTRFLIAACSATVTKLPVILHSNDAVKMSARLLRQLIATITPKTVQCELCNTTLVASEQVDFASNEKRTILRLQRPLPSVSTSASITLALSPTSIVHAPAAPSSRAGEWGGGRRRGERKKEKVKTNRPKKPTCSHNETAIIVPPPFHCRRAARKVRLGNVLFAREYGKTVLALNGASSFYESGYECFVCTYINLWWKFVVLI